MSNPPSKILIKEGLVYEPVEHDLYDTWALSERFMLAKHDLRATWKGGLLTFEQWDEICGFLRWSQKKHKAEALLTLFYNKLERIWAVWAFPQEPNGMTVKSLPDHPMYKEDRAKFGKGWIQLGSVHHHCTAGAFQSGTDTDDEKDRDGVHITLGHMDKESLDIHLRQVFGGEQSISGLHQWVLMPDWMDNVPPKYQYDLYIKALKEAGTEEKFPEAWKERIIEKKIITDHRHTYSNTTRDTGSGGNGASTSGVTNILPRQTTGYRDSCKKQLRFIASRLQLSLTEVYHLLTFSNLAKLPQKDFENRCKFLTECHVVNIPPFWPEELVKEMIDEDKKEAAAKLTEGAGAPFTGDNARKPYTQEELDLMAGYGIGD